MGYGFVNFCERVYRPGQLGNNCYMRNHYRQSQPLGLWRLCLTAFVVTVLILTLASCLGPSGDKSKTGKSSTTSTAGWKKYSSSGGNVTVKAPATWEFKTAKEAGLQAGKLFLLLGPAKDNYTTNVQLSKEEVPGRDLPGYITQYEKNTKQDPGTKIMKQTSSTPFKDGVRKAYDYELAAGGRTYKLAVDTYYVQKDNDFYVVQMVTDQRLYAEQKNVFAALLETLKIK